VFRYHILWLNLRSVPGFADGRNTGLFSCFPCPFTFTCRGCICIRICVSISVSISASVSVHMSLPHSCLHFKNETLIETTSKNIHEKNSFCQRNSSTKNGQKRTSKLRSIKKEQAKENVHINMGP